MTPYGSSLVVVRRTEVTHRMDGAILFLILILILYSVPSSQVVGGRSVPFCILKMGKLRFSKS